MMIHIMRIDDRRNQIHVTIKKTDYYHMNRKNIKMFQTGWSEDINFPSPK